jgi:hypothetical protein
MQWIHRLLKSEIVFGIIAFLASCYIRLTYRTCRWQVIGSEVPESYLKANKPFIVCFWHGRLGMLPYAWPWKKHPFHMLISSHRDGRMIGQIVAHFGYTPIWGSTMKGGTQALRAMLRYLRDGNTIGITPDGPRGPSQVASSGIITLAMLGNVDIIPITYSTSRRIQLKSWDRFHVPLPFGRGVFLWGDPVNPPSGKEEMNIEAIRQQLEAQMTDLQNRADKLMGLY